MQWLRRQLLPIFLITSDILIIVIAAILSLDLRFEDRIVKKYLLTLIQQLPVLELCYLLGFWVTKVYRRLWQYAGIRELMAIVGGAVGGTLLFYGYMNIIGAELPRSFFSLTLFFVLAGVCGSRLILRAILRYGNNGKWSVDKIPVLIVGAGDAGHIMLRELNQHYGMAKQVIGLIDDDKSKQGQLLTGVPVLGGRNQIQKIVDHYGVKEIIIAMPSLPTADIVKIANICSLTKCDVKILPGFYSTLDEKNIGIENLRAVNVEDLLHRDPVTLDMEKIAAYLTGKRVMVTGAGGSIGSEICRQVMKVNPDTLYMLGRGENSIYEINQELRETYDSEKLVPIISNVVDRKVLSEVFDHYKPQVVFHAAAHKHVPLMEAQPREAVMNNVWGSWNVGELAGENGAEAFVMISTDKAVNPTSVMGATKRAGEKIMQSLNTRYATRYMAVRFGNVLGSRGSVVPLFKKQIAKGGPVTVTDPEMERYFMTISEASSLVIQAGSMGKGGEVFVLDMGKPVKIVELARNLIRLAGKEVSEIDIKFTGLRPGEKLFEELLTAEEGTVKTTHKKIFQAMLFDEETSVLRAKIEKVIAAEDEMEIIEQLKNIIPTYTPNHF